MPERLTLADALGNWTVRELGKEHGEVNFDRFVELAKQSSVPTAFADVVGIVVRTVKKGRPDMDFDEAYLQTATRLFEREFTNPTIASYAVIYGHALALTKTWLEANDKLERMDYEESRLQEYLQGNYTKVVETLNHGPDDTKESLVKVYYYPEHIGSEMETLLGTIQEQKPIFTSLVEYVRSEAVIKCGQVVVLEQQRKNKPIRQKIGEKLLGGYATEKDFGRIRTEIEEYFTDPMKQTRMTLLLNSEP